MDKICHGYFSRIPVQYSDKLQSVIASLLHVNVSLIIMLVRDFVTGVKIFLKVFVWRETSGHYNYLCTPI